MSAEKIALGTAQFGMEYGVANKKGRPSKEEIFNILEAAFNEGINTLDTAYGYGESEALIGDFSAISGKRFNIISKISNADTSELDKYFHVTLDRLKAHNIYAYLAHSFNDIFRHKGFWDKLEEFKKKGLVNKIGVSLYRNEELDSLLHSGLSFDIIQVPYNIFDQRFDEYFAALSQKGIEIHTRSVFLQGFFFLKKDYIYKRFPSARNKVEELYRILKDSRLSMNSLCLSFVLLNDFVDKVVIGVDSLQQLGQNISSITDLDRLRRIYNAVKSLKFHDEKVILPYNWK